MIFTYFKPLSLNQTRYNKMKCSNYLKMPVLSFHLSKIGEAFDDPRTKRQLEMIASAPVAKHVFNVTDFDALDSIREQLEENIAIEGMFTDKSKK